MTLLFVYIGVLAALVQGGLMGHLSRRFTESRLVLAGLAATTGGLARVAGTHRLPTLLGALVVVSFGVGVVMPSLTSLVSRSVAAHEQGAALGAFQSMGSLGRVVGPLAAEVALGRWGVAAPALGAAALALLAAGGALLAAGSTGTTTSPSPR